MFYEDKTQRTLRVDRHSEVKQNLKERKRQRGAQRGKKGSWDVRLRQIKGNTGDTKKEGALAGEKRTSETEMTENS